MLCSAYSIASDCVIALTPPLAAEYGTRRIPRVAFEETLTMVPPPRLSRCGNTAWQAYSVGMSERRISASICSGSNSANGRMRIAPPTPLMRMSMPPNVRTAKAIADAAPSYVSRSATKAAVSAPLASAATSQTNSARSTNSTLPPSAAARSATARPMPCAAPVTTMTLPANRCALMLSSVLR